ncbi:hypothetical protein PR202_gb28407 [Eleusine coracana subsp. coracana]|uniref:Glycosyl transferase 64 domain-containing protein n=1 Tax=Eleusine coracana subsp. coracana TaxID=191504 RepID=A0AAV5FUA7_ELECO|nr:hypothetical protein PR202_gb28407 [Eleusine coracana subsp. coracana]
MICPTASRRCFCTTIATNQGRPRQCSWKICAAPARSGSAHAAADGQAAAPAAGRGGQEARPGPARRHALPLRHAAHGSRFVARFALCCLLLVLAAAATTLALGLTLHRSSLAAASSPRSRGFSVVINTWKRHALLRRTVAHYAACAGVDAVHVVWSEPREPSDSMRRSIANSTRRGNVRFVINQGDSLNNRFRPINGLATDAVFSVDDDLIVPCSTLRFAYTVWRTAPSAMVGFVPRMHWLAHTASSVMVSSIIGCILLIAYPTLSPTLTDRNCEDIAMSFLVANVTGAPPIWVQGRIYEIGSSGISSLKGHSLQRSRCLNTFAAMYGHMPLVATTVKAIDSRRSWFW